MRVLPPLVYIFSGFVIGAMLFIGASVVLAWTGPTSAPPNGNVSAPINVGTTDQIKDAGLGINSLAVFGNAIISGASRYLNFGSTAGSEGYGIRDNAGVMEYKDSDGDWIALNSLGGGGSDNDFVISSDTQNVNLYVLAGSPATAGTYTFTINPSVTIGSASSASAAVSTGVWPAGSSVTLINNGNIYGRGGDGGGGGTCQGGFYAGGHSGGNCAAGSVSGAGGPAMSLSYNITIDNTNGAIFGGGGGGGGGEGGNMGSCIQTGGGGGGGQGAGNSSGGLPNGSAGTVSGPGNGGAISNPQNCVQNAGNGGSGGAFATAGSNGGAAAFYGSGGGTGGAAGKAILLNGKTITWQGGNDATHVKGTVQ